LIPAVYAWHGTLDQAVQRAIPGLSPALITRDPLRSGPLAHHPRYQALTARPEAQMAGRKLEEQPSIDLAGYLTVDVCAVDSCR
jgi:hypothetical protein